MRFFLLLLGLILLSCGKQEGKKPNIIIINVDDLGWRDTGFQGSKFYETPNIDSLASQSMIFTNGYASAANCTPSRACLMTGKWTPRHGMYTVRSSERGDSTTRKLIPIPNKIILDEQFLTLPAFLKENGYTTCLSGKWHLSRDPLESGFDYNIGGGLNGMPKSYYPPYVNVKLEAQHGERLTDLIMTKTLDFINEEKADPFFVYYAPYAVHKPVQPIDSLKKKYENKQSLGRQNNIDYATMVENLDYNIGRLLNKLTNENLLKNTFIFFTSDNGGMYDITDNSPLRAGKGTYYEGGTRVPFFFYKYGMIAANTKSSQQISNLDLFPTIIEITGSNLEDYELDGTSILSLLKQKNTVIDRPLYWHFPVYIHAVNTSENQNRDSLFRTRPGSAILYNNWKLLHYFEDNEVELYNLETDIGEKTDLSKKMPEKTQKLLKMLDKWRQEVDAPIPKELNPDFKSIN